MVISRSKKSMKGWLLRGSLLGVLIGLGFRTDDIKALSDQTRNKFAGIYDADAEKDKLKRFEIHITDDGFFRYRKFLITGKQEYYSFSLLRLADIRYLGNTSTGLLVLETVSDDIIVQTYNDRRGNVDSMTTGIKIPVRMIEPEDINVIHNNLLAIQAQLQKRD